MNLKNIFILQAVIALTINANAQTELPKNAENNPQGSTSENITMQSTINGKTTTIELKNGQMYMDGKKVDGTKVGANLKSLRKMSKDLNGKDMPELEIIIPNDKNENAKNAEQNPTDEALGNSPMLGVSTKASSAFRGVEIIEVKIGSPAEKAGLKPGDVITKLGNISVESAEELADAVANFKTGENVEVIYLRNNKQRTTVAELASKNERNSNNPFGGENPFADLFGNGQNPFENMQKMFENNNSNSEIFSNKKIANANAPKIGIVAEDRADNTGVRVAEITEDGIAQKAGLKIDDVITTFGGTQINNIDNLAEAITSIKTAKDVVVNIKRGKETKTLYLVIPTTLRKQDF